MAAPELAHPAEDGGGIADRGAAELAAKKIGDEVLDGAAFLGCPDLDSAHQRVRQIDRRLHGTSKPANQQTVKSEDPPGACYGLPSMQQDEFVTDASRGVFQSWGRP